MRLGTAMVEACCAAQIDTNNKVNRAITSMVLRWRMETRDVEIAFVEEMAILSLLWLVICVFMVTSLWSWVVATPESRAAPGCGLGHCSLPGGEMVVPPPEAFPFESSERLLNFPALVNAQ